MGKQLMNMEQMRSLIGTYYPRQLVERENDIFVVQLSDTTVELDGIYFLANMIFWEPYLKRGIPISSRYLFKQGEVLTDSVISDIRTYMFVDFVARTDMDLVEQYNLQDDLFRVCESFYNVYALELGEFHRSISIFEAGEAFRAPHIQEAIAIPDIHKEVEKGIRCAEDYLKERYEIAMKAFSSDKSKGSVLYPYVKLGVVALVQVSQVAVAAGTRTDVDEKMIGIPIIDSYANTLKGIVPYFIDSLSAKKSEVYNDQAMPTAQYSNRKTQLLASELRFIYPGDCGSRVYVTLKLHRAYKSRYIGKFICTDEEKHALVELTPENIDQYADKTIRMRSVMTCRYTDGYCHHCGGRLAMYLPPTTLPGFASAIELMSTVSQLVLSNKHVAKTNSSVYRIPSELMDYFVNIHGDIYFRDRVDLSKIAIGVPMASVEKLDDLNYLKKGNDIDEQYFSSLTHITIGNADTLEPITRRVPMCDSDRMTPPSMTFLALEMIMKHPEDVITSGNMVWFKLSHFDRTQPFMRCVVVNDSTRDFVKMIETMVMYQIKNRTSCSEALRDICNSVWKRTSPHILHLETVLRATMITSDYDYSIPVVEDPEHVKFAQLGRIIPRRSIGTQMAFERAHLYFFDAGTYIFPKTSSVFDPYLAPNDPPQPILIRPDLVDASVRAKTGKKVIT